MNNNSFVIAAAGSGKTTLLVKTALENPDKSILITTYTESNEQEIRDKQRVNRQVLKRLLVSILG